MFKNQLKLLNSAKTNLIDANQKLKNFLNTEINRAAAELAQQAAGRKAWVAGSIGPTGVSLHGPAQTSRQAQGAA